MAELHTHIIDDRDDNEGLKSFTGDLLENRKKELMTQKNMTAEEALKFIREFEPHFFNYIENPSNQETRSSRKQYSKAECQDAQAKIQEKIEKKNLKHIASNHMHYSFSSCGTCPSRQSKQSRI